jgi:hypothetical protein
MGDVRSLLLDLAFHGLGVLSPLSNSLLRGIDQGFRRGECLPGYRVLLHPSLSLGRMLIDQDHAYLMLPNVKKAIFLRLVVNHV